MLSKGYSNLKKMRPTAMQLLADVVSILIDYYIQLQGIEVPYWIRNENLGFEKPYYHSKRISDFEKVRLIYANPAPFRVRNVYFDLEGIGRV